MKKTYSFKQVITLVVFCVAAAVCTTIMLFQVFAEIDSKQKQQSVYYDKLNEIIELAEEYYIGEIDEEFINNGISAGYVAGLNDKYAAYVTAEDAEASKNVFQGLNTGIGIQISMHPDTKNIYVLEVHKDSPAEAAGILRHDQIVSIDGHIIAEYGYSEILAYIKTLPLGTKAHAVLERDGKKVETDIELATYNSQSVFYRMIDDIGYIQITTFNELSVDQFISAVDTLTEQGATGLVFDLRGNGGGTLNSVYHMIDYLIPEGLVIKVEYKNKNYNQVYMSDDEEVNLPMVVLTDENTASASELFSQSLKDYNKAVTIGRKTYGKGVVQRTFSLSDGSLVKFTIAKYYTANGTCLDGVGVVPDVEVNWEQNELNYRLVNGIEKDKDFLAALEYFKTGVQPS